MLPSDRHLVIDNWQKSYKNAHAAGLIQMNRWAAVMIAELEIVLDKPNVETIVAFDDSLDGEWDVYGWMTANIEKDRPLVYYCYVAGPYRGRGYARALFAAHGIDPSRPFDCACKTGVVTDLRYKIPSAKFDPIRGRLLDG